MCLKLLITDISSFYLKAITPEEIEDAFMLYQHSLPTSYLRKTKEKFVINVCIYIFYCLMLSYSGECIVSY